MTDDALRALLALELNEEGRLFRIYRILKEAAVLWQRNTRLSDRKAAGLLRIDRNTLAAWSGRNYHHLKLCPQCGSKNICRVVKGRQVLGYRCLSCSRGWLRTGAAGSVFPAFLERKGPW